MRHIIAKQFLLSLPKFHIIAEQGLDFFLKKSKGKHGETSIKEVTARGHPEICASQY